MAETIQQKAIREAEEACQHAVAITPEQYRGHIVFISQSKKLGYGKNAPTAYIRLPYMKVDGRVIMAHDEHQEKGAHLNITTEFLTIDEALVCRATATSALRGTVIAHSQIVLADFGVNKTNPLENAETSAIGRALGFLGYGIFPTGIASAEEVLSALDRQAEQTDTEQNPVENHRVEEHSQTVPAMSEKQQGLLWGLLAKAGVHDGHKRGLINLRFPGGIDKQRGSELIGELKDDASKLSWEWFYAYLTLMQSLTPTTPEMISQYCQENFNGERAKNLNGEQQKQLIAWIVADDDDIPEPKTPSDVYRPKIDAVSAKEWGGLMKKINDDTGLSSNDIAKWAIDKFGNGNESDITELSKDAYDQIKEMYPAEFKEAISNQK